MEPPIIEDGKKYLVSTDNYFRAPDGESYCAVWGTCNVKKIEQILGFTPIRPSTNWFLKIGTENRFVIVAGCQIHYLVRTDDLPTIKLGTYTDKDTGKVYPNNLVYIME